MIEKLIHYKEMRVCKKMRKAKKLLAEVNKEYYEKQRTAKYFVRGKKKDKDFVYYHTILEYQQLQMKYFDIVQILLSIIDIMNEIDKNEP